MPRRLRSGKARRDQLDRPQRTELRTGRSQRGPDGPAFADEDDRRAAWDEHREELLAASKPGERPWAYFAYDLQLDDPERFGRGYEPRLGHVAIDHHAIALAERGLLAPDEEDLIVYRAGAGLAPSLQAAAEIILGRRAQQQ